MDKPQRQETEYTIDVMQLLGALLKKWWIIAVSAIVVAALLFCYTYLFVTPKYEAKALMYVNNNALGVSVAKISTSDLNVSKSLINTYSVIAKARLTLEEVIREADLPYSCGQLKGMVSISPESDTEIFAIAVASSDPEEACVIANTFAKVLPNKIEGVVNGASAKLVDSAVTPENPSSPNYGKRTALGFLIGFVIGAAYIVLVEILDDTVKSSDWLLQTFGEDIPLLAVVHDAGSSSGGYGKRYGYGYSKHYGYGYGKHYGYGYGKHYGYGYGYEKSYEEANAKAKQKAESEKPKVAEKSGNGGGKK